MTRRIIRILGTTLGLSMLLINHASAHVVVRPSEVAISERVTFAVSVPNEHDTPVVAVRLVVPEGLRSVRPLAKPGWDITVSKTGEGEQASAREIIWTSTGGTVPVNLRDDFYFGAMAPADETKLVWKAYETYASGLVVAWEQEPSEAEDNKPYSVTRVVAETEGEVALNRAQEEARSAAALARWAIFLAVVAFSLAGRSLYREIRKS